VNQDLVAPPAGVVTVAGALALVVAALVVLLLTVALLRVRATATRDREAARAEAAALRDRIEDVERRLAPDPGERRVTRPVDPEFVITHVGDDPAPTRHASGPAPERPEPALFADIVLRESVVRAASLAHGVRVALAPETRNRIRFEVRREVRRARKQRRADTRLARREHASRQRAVLTDDEDAA
jgi:hypothetical protein